MISWAQDAPAIAASFLSSLVEFVEALTIVLAAGITRGWRSAIVGTLLAAAVLFALVLAFGTTLERIPIHILQLTIGTLLLLFGMRWARKAILRASGAIGLHDEAAAFAKEQQFLRKFGSGTGWIDLIGFTAAFKGVLLEGLEVVFIVIAVGSTARSLPSAALGAATAGVLVILFGLLVHRPLTRVPENALKFAVAVMLSSFGTFWVGEGLHVQWYGKDWALMGLIAAYLFVAWMSVRLARRILWS